MELLGLSDVTRLKKCSFLAWPLTLRLVVSSRRHERASSKAVQDKPQGLLLKGSLPNTFFLCSIRSWVCQVIPIDSFCINLS